MPSVRFIHCRSKTCESNNLAFNKPDHDEVKLEQIFWTQTIFIEKMWTSIMTYN